MDWVHPEVCSLFEASSEVAPRAPGEIKTPSVVASFHLGVNDLGSQTAKESRVQVGALWTSPPSEFGELRGLWLWPEPRCCQTHFSASSSSLLPGDQDPSGPTLPLPSPPPFCPPPGVSHHILVLADSTSSLCSASLLTTKIYFPSLSMGHIFCGLQTDQSLSILASYNVEGGESKGILKAP